MPKKGLLRQAETMAALSPEPDRLAMQSGIAPWPGKTTRSARIT
jgi:hypothetical protein